MLSREDARRLLTLALGELAPEWEIVGECAQLTYRDPQHWLSGIGTFGATLRHRTTGALKVLGRRSGPEPNATFHRGVSFLVLEAYARRNLDPIGRYFEEVGLGSRRFGPRPLIVFGA